MISKAASMWDRIGPRHAVILVKLATIATVSNAIAIVVDDAAVLEEEKVCVDLSSFDQYRTKSFGTPKLQRLFATAGQGLLTSISSLLSTFFAHSRP